MQSHYNVYTIIILLFRMPMWSCQWLGPRPAGSGRAWASNMKLFCGPGLDIIVAGRAGPGRAGPGLGLIIQFAGRARAGSAQLLRARAEPGSQIILPGLGLYFRPVQGATVYY